MLAGCVLTSVHQGDLEGIKGVYHITCVDAVSQWQVEACVEGNDCIEELTVAGRARWKIEI